MFNAGVDDERSNFPSQEQENAGKYLGRAGKVAMRRIKQIMDLMRKQNAN